MPLVYWGLVGRNRDRLRAIRDEAPTAVEALARMFTDDEIVDDGTVAGRIGAILAATEHRLVPGLHTGLAIGVTGFREEFEDPWEESTDQVGHFLTAVRLRLDPEFLSKPLFPLLLGAEADDDIALRLIVGHEKAPDPPDISAPRLRTILSVVRHIRAQYRTVDEEDLDNFRSGSLDKIAVGEGLGNSMADLRLSYVGWRFGRWISDRRFRTTGEVAAWIGNELGPPASA